MEIFSVLFGKVLGFIYDLIPNYGITIILFTILTKILLFPLTYKQLKMSKEMAVIQPKMKAVQEKYKNDKEMMNRKMLELYKEHNYNPFSGCLPSIVNLILIIGLFGVLREPGKYVFATQELLEQATHQPFLWIPNLSLPDLMSNLIPAGPEFLTKIPGLLPIVSAVLTYFSMQMTPMPAQQEGQKQPNMMAVLKFLMPGMILLYGTGFSAGLVLYWTTSTLLQIVQQYFMNRMNKAEEMN